MTLRATRGGGFRRRARIETSSSEDESLSASSHTSSYFAEALPPRTVTSSPFTELDASRNPSQSSNVNGFVVFHAK